MSQYPQVSILTPTYNRKQFIELCIFNLINQVDKYSDFLPWCKKSKIISDTNNVMIGVITVSKNFADWTFTTKNNYIKNKKIMFLLFFFLTVIFALNFFNINSV